MPRVLITCYSRTGTTQTVANRLLAATGGDSDPILDLQDRSGLLGYLRSGFDALMGGRAPLAAPRKPLGTYDLVIIGTPTWAARISAPVRTFLLDHAAELHDVAFFVTYDGRGGPGVLGQLEQLAGKAPVAALALTARQVRSGALASLVQPFVDRIEQHLGRGPAPIVGTAQLSPQIQP